MISTPRSQLRDSEIARKKIAKTVRAKREKQLETQEFIVDDLLLQVYKEDPIETPAARQPHTE